MAKSSASTNFRKVNVDELDEERFQEDAAGENESQIPSESEILNLLNSKKNTEALKMMLKNPPYNGSKKIKDDAFRLVLNVLKQYKSADIAAAVKQLSSKEIDTLMKYIYRGFAEPTDNSSGILLTWHDKCYAVGGSGSIMRVLTSRKSV